MSIKTLKVFCMGGDLLVFENVKALCDKKGISITQLEKDAGLSTGSINKWKTSSPTAKSLQSVAKVLKVKMEKLLQE